MCLLAPEANQPISTFAARLDAASGPYPPVSMKSPQAGRSSDSTPPFALPSGSPRSLLDAEALSAALTRCGACAKHPHPAVVWHDCSLIDAYAQVKCFFPCLPPELA